MVLASGGTEAVFITPAMFTPQHHSVRSTRMTQLVDEPTVSLHTAWGKPWTTPGSADGAFNVS